MLILHVDDDLEDLELFQEVIESIGPEHRVFSATNGQERLHIAKVIIPDIIFLDINMPIMNGRETLHELRQNNLLKTIPVCMLSTSSNAMEIMRYQELGVHGFIVKPNTFADLCQAVKKFILPELTTRPATKYWIFSRDR